MLLSPRMLLKCVCGEGPLLGHERQMLVWVAVWIIVQALHTPVFPSKGNIVEAADRECSLGVGGADEALFYTVSRVSNCCCCDKLGLVEVLDEPFHLIKIHFSINSSLNHLVLNKRFTTASSSLTSLNGGSFRQYMPSTLVSALKL